MNSLAVMRQNYQMTIKIHLIIVKTIHVFGPTYLPSNDQTLWLDDSISRTPSAYNSGISGCPSDILSILKSCDDKQEELMWFEKRYNSEYNIFTDEQWLCKNNPDILAQLAG